MSPALSVWAEIFPAKYHLRAEFLSNKIILETKWSIISFI